MFGEHTITEVLVFVGLVTFCLWLDLYAHRGDKAVSARDAGIWTAGWVSLALLFCGYIGYTEGADQAQLFLAGYLLEESLSVDNLFVMMAIFGSFSVPDHLQHRVLFYGILGAIVMRLIFVAAGSSLVAMFGPYALAGFGVFVIWTAWKMFQAMYKEKKGDCRLLRTLGRALDAEVHSRASASERPRFLRQGTVQRQADLESHPAFPLPCGCGNFGCDVRL